MPSTHTDDDDAENLVLRGAFFDRCWVSTDRSAQELGVWEDMEAARGLISPRSFGRVKLWLQLEGGVLLLLIVVSRNYCLPCESCGPLCLLFFVFLGACNKYCHRRDSMVALQ